MATYTLTHSISIPGKTLSSQTAQTAAAEARIDAEQLGATASNVVFDIAFPAPAQIKCVFLYSTVDCTIKTNSSTEPDDTIELAAKTAIAWDLNSAHDCPFSEAVEKLYITNDSTPDTAGLVSVFVLYDPTA